MAPTHTENAKLMYQPFSSILNPGFWQQLTNIKLDKLKLSTEPVNIKGFYSCNLSESLPCLASFEHNSFSSRNEPSNRFSCPLNGQLICTNIMQEFLEYNKKELLDRQGALIWESIFDGRALDDPEKYLSRFGLLVHADLKKYRFLYWFSFPAVNYPKDAFFVKRSESVPSNSSTASVSSPILNYMGEQALRMLQEAYDKPSSERAFQRGYFIVKHFRRISTGSEEVAVFSLKEYPMAVQTLEDQKDCVIYFAYSDPSASPTYPGWPLRNFLCLIAVQFQLNQVKLIRIRKGQPKPEMEVEISYSMVLEAAFELSNECVKSSVEAIPEPPLITGWEKNEQQQMAPKRVNLSSLLDPKKLAEDAVNLNLRLMKWRLLPNLDLDKIARTKCLLLGCGTLGCHIARGLLAWGIKDISILDNAKISYSNPVRQSLYTFDDCAKSGASFKAEAAAASLKRIHPSVNVKSIILSIPMPGHHVADKEIEQTKKDVKVLEDLIEQHDAIFLLMDTRESRWLPTVIAMSKQKLVINAAIGFDTFLLQRYGIRDYSTDEQGTSNASKANQDARLQDNSQPSQSKANYGFQSASFLASDKLGCYFCNDIVAPGDSTLDRTLDQQCTVSRPGVSMIVSAMAVELLASIVSSRLGAFTPAPTEIQTNLAMGDDDCGSELGIVPHSIRGTLTRYYTYMPTSPCFNKCSACSPAVINAYRTSGYDFLQCVFDDPSYLEEVAGLKDLQNINDNVWALESDEDTDELRCVGTSK